MNKMPLDGRFRQGMRRLAAGICIITARHRGRVGGLTATAVCSLSLDPPTLLVCVNRQADTHPLIVAGKRFCVNVLGRRHRALAERFAGMNGVEGEARFAAGAWDNSATGAPVLADALASFDCAVSERIAASTHTIFIGRVLDVRVRESGQPLIYASGGFAGLAKLPVKAGGR